MKKSCFIRSIIILTILTAVILYLINHKFSELVVNPGKHLIINQINKDFEYVKDTPEKDSLKLLINNYIFKIKNLNNLSDKTVGDFADSLQNALQDSIIDRREFNSLSRLLKRKAAKK